MAVMSPDGNEVLSLTVSQRCHILQGQQHHSSSLHKLLLSSVFFIPRGAAGWDLIVFIGTGSSQAC